MNWIHWILNIAALLLWIDWRTGFAAHQPQPVISLASALRETNRRRSRGWGSLAVFVALVIVRPFFYVNIGSAMNWTPVVDVLGVSLPFRSDLFERMFAYSTAGYLSTLGFFYGCLLFLAVFRTTAPETEVMRRFLRAQLGWLDRLPAFAKAIVPFLGAGLFWAGSVPVLVALGIAPAMPRPEFLWAQAGILALASILAWKWFFGILFLVHVLNSYVYLGTHPAWAFVSEVGKAMLKPLAVLRVGKLELAPIIATAVLFAVCELAVRPFTLSWFERFMA